MKQGLTKTDERAKQDLGCENADYTEEIIHTDYIYMVSNNMLVTLRTR